MIILALGIWLFVLLVKYSWTKAVVGWKVIPFILAVMLAFGAFVFGGVDTITSGAELLARVSYCYSS